MSPPFTLIISVPSKATTTDFVPYHKTKIKNIAGWQSKNSIHADRSKWMLTKCAQKYAGNICFHYFVFKSILIISHDCAVFLGGYNYRTVLCGLVLGQGHL